MTDEQFEQLMEKLEIITDQLSAIKSEVSEVTYNTGRVDDSDSLRYLKSIDKGIDTISGQISNLE